METWKIQLAGGEWTVCALAEGIYRVILRRDARQRESMLTRYGIVQTDLGAVEAAPRLWFTEVVDVGFAGSLIFTMASGDDATPAKDAVLRAIAPLTRQ